MIRDPGHSVDSRAISYMQNKYIAEGLIYLRGMLQLILKSCEY